MASAMVEPFLRAASMPLRASRRGALGAWRRRSLRPLSTGMPAPERRANSPKKTALRDGFTRVGGGGTGRGSGPWFHPLEDLEAVFVGESAADDDDEVDEGPDAEAAEGDDHEGGGAVFADVEAVGTEDAEEPAEEEGDETGFCGDGSGHDFEFI